MEKEKKKNGSKKVVDKKNAVGLIFRFAPLIMSVTAIALAALLLNHAVFASGIFTLKPIRVIWHDRFGASLSGKYSDFFASIGSGTNIFKLDINGISSDIVEKHPEFKKCVIERNFPDELVVNVHMRQPVSQIQYGKYYIVDGEAVLLTEPVETRLEGIPIVTGINWRPSGRVGNKLHSPRLVKALELLLAVKNTDLLESHTLSRIDVSDHRNLMFFIDDGLQIKIGRARFDERLELLRETLSSSYVERETLEYIDLRFDDIVFGTK